MNRHKESCYLTFISNYYTLYDVSNLETSAISKYQCWQLKLLPTNSYFVRMILQALKGHHVQTLDDKKDA